LVQTLTWNVEGFSPTSTDQVNGLFHPAVEFRPHLIVISLEELFEMKLYNFSKIMSNSSMPPEAKLWEKLLIEALHTIDDSYWHLKTEVNGGVMMIVFSNLEKKEVKLQKTQRINLGVLGGMMANKGAVILNLLIRNVRFQFIACHLESGENEKANTERLSQIQAIAPAAFDFKRQEDSKKKVDLD
jgi:hypothetical protein